MTRVDGTTFRLTKCRTCGVESKGIPEPTLSPGLVLAYCVGCRKKTPATDLGDVVVEAPATRRPDPFEDRDPTPEEVDDASGMATLGEGVEVETPSGLCPECQELGTHDPGCPEIDRVQRAYLEWRKTPDGEAVIVAIRRRAIELRRRGWSRYGIQALAEVVRFDRALSVGPDVAGYKVNNSHLSRLARDLMDEDPDLRGFFEVRELRAREAE